jgi:hypothetical protein
MEMLINLIIQIVSGVVGGNAVGAALKDYNLGNIGNTIAGAIGGLGGGQLLQAAIPAIAGAAGGDLDIGAIVGQIIGGGAGGAILTVIAGLVKSMMASQQTRELTLRMFLFGKRVPTFPEHALRASCCG